MTKKVFSSPVDHFVYETSKDVSALLAREPLGFQNIEAFFRNRVDYVSGPQFKACSSSPPSSRGYSTSMPVRSFSFLAASDNALHKCLDAAQQEGEIPQNSDCRTLAKYLMCFLEGVMVMGQTNPSKNELELVVGTVLLTVKG